MVLEAFLLRCGSPGWFAVQAGLYVHPVVEFGVEIMIQRYGVLVAVVSAALLAAWSFHQSVVGGDETGKTAAKDKNDPQQAEKKAEPKSELPPKKAAMKMFMRK